MPTAIVRAYCPDGFVFASDGRFANFTTKQPISDNAQKIVQIGDLPLAYALTGLTKLGHRDDHALDRIAFDMHTEVTRAIQSIRFRDSWSLEHFAKRIARSVTSALQSVRSEVDLNYEFPSDGRRGTLIARMFLDGFVRRLPSRATIRFFHETGTVKDAEVSIEDCQPEMVWYYGSALVADAFAGDNQQEKFARFKVQRGPHHKSGPSRITLIFPWHT